MEEGAGKDEGSGSDRRLSPVRDMDTDGIYTVTRNKIVNYESKLLDMVRTGKPKKDIDALIKAMKPKSNYGGIYYKIYFRVNHPIQVTQLGFYGPFEEKEAEFKVHVQVFAPKKAKQIYPESSSRPIAEIISKIVGAKQDIFYAEFPDPVWIEPSIWYLIDFKLEGPATRQCLETMSTVHVSAGEGDRNISFEFQGGCKQIPCIRFKLAA